MGDLKLIENFLHPAAHDLGADAQVFHPKDELILHHLDHHLRFGILKHKADHIRELPRVILAGIATGYAHLAAPLSAIKVRH